MRIKYNDSHEHEEWEMIFDEMMEEYTKKVCRNEKYLTSDI